MADATIAVELPVPAGHLARARGLAVNGGALVVNVVASAVTGLVFWIVAARAVPPHVVAEATAAVTAITSVVSLAQQSFVLTLPSLLSVSPEPRRLTRSIYGAALLTTAIAAPLYIVLGPHLADGLDFLGDARVATAFVLGSLVWCIFSLQDAVLTGLRKAPLVLLENTAWGVLRLVAVVVAAAAGIELGVGWLVASWVVPAGALVAIVSWYLFASATSPLAVARGTEALARRTLVSFLSAELAASAISSVMTLVIAAYMLTTLGASDAAPLLTAATLMLVIEGAMASFAQALSVEARRREGADARRDSLLRLTFAFLGLLSLGAIAITAVGGDLVMSLFGSAYRETGGTALAILMLGLPFRSIVVVSNADNRIRNQGGRNLAQQVVAAAVGIVLLASGSFTTVVAMAWIPVIIKAATAAVAAVQLRQGRLQLLDLPIDTTSEQP